MGPPPARPPGTVCPAVAEEDDAVAEGDDVARLTESPITAQITTAQAATIHRLLLFDSNRRTHGRRACSALVAESGWGGDAAPASAELPAVGGSDGAPETGLVGS
jgi:hypothetical protein